MGLLRLRYEWFRLPDKSNPLMLLRDLIKLAISFDQGLLNSHHYDFPQCENVELFGLLRECVKFFRLFYPAVSLRLNGL